MDNSLRLSITDKKIEPNCITSNQLITTKTTVSSRSKNENLAMVTDQIEITSLEDHPNIKI